MEPGFLSFRAVARASDSISGRLCDRFYARKNRILRHGEKGISHVSAEAPTKFRAVIVDDEELARQVLREFLGKHQEIDLIGECANGFEAVKMVAEQKPDLVFLDIQMPKLDGFEVLELIGSDATVVFVTAHDNYAIRAFEVHAVDYLLKPVAAARFDAALERAKERLSGKSQPATLAASDLAASARPPAHYVDRVPVRDGAKVSIIPVAKLDYVEAQDDYVALASEGKKHLKQQTIASIEAALDPARFLRIHRSYIVNLERVVRVEPYAKDSHVAILTNGTQLPVSRAGYARLREILDR
jgi:two-component system LytT family response regulator